MKNSPKQYAAAEQTGKAMADNPEAPGWGKDRGLTRTDRDRTGPSENIADLS